MRQGRGFAVSNPGSLIPNPGSASTNEKPRRKRGLRRTGRAGSGRNDVDRLARFGALDLEFDRAVDQRIQGVVAAEADAAARMEARAALAHDDVAGLDRLAAIDLHAEVLRIGVATVAG